MSTQIELRLQRIERRIQEIIKSRCRPYDYFVGSDGQPTFHLKNLRETLLLKEAFLRIEQPVSIEMERRERDAATDDGGDSSEDKSEIDRNDPAYIRKKDQKNTAYIESYKQGKDKTNKTILEVRKDIEKEKGKPTHFIELISYFPNPAKYSIYDMFGIEHPQENKYKKEDNSMIKYLVPVYADGSLGDHYLYPVDGSF